MTPISQIEETQRALQDLQADEVELSGLYGEQAAGIQALKNEGSKDFALLASLEGKRAALGTMLSEQRAHIAQAQARLAGLEAARLRSEQLEEIRAKVTQLKARREETDQLLLHLGTFLTEQLGRITAARVAWAQELADAQEQAAAVYRLPRLLQIGFSDAVSRRAWHAAFNEIGSDAALALTLVPSDKQAQGMAQPYPRPGLVNMNDESYLIGDAKGRPLLSWLDRPVMLTIVQAVLSADQNAPDPYSGGER
jgi:hypothetical protein